MDAFIKLAIGAGYLSLVLELIVLHVPSAASSRSIWSPSPSISANYSGRFRKLIALSKPLKLALLLPPLLLVWAVFLWPLKVFWPGLDWADDRLYEPTPFVALSGIAVIVTGRTIGILASLRMKDRAAKDGDAIALQTDSLFRHSRNPGLVGMCVFLTGVWILLPSLSLLAGIAFYIAYMHCKVLMEENFLANKFGAPYLDYCARTGRYWP